MGYSWAIYRGVTKPLRRIDPWKRRFEKRSP
jgi:hypothetical protein